MAETPECRAKGILKSLVSRLAYRHNVHVDWEAAPTSAYGATKGQADITLTLRDAKSARCVVWYIEVKAGKNTPSAKQELYLKRKYAMGCEAWVLWADDTQELIMFAEAFVSIARCLFMDTPRANGLRLSKHTPPVSVHENLHTTVQKLKVEREFNKELIPLAAFAPAVKE